MKLSAIVCSLLFSLNVFSAPLAAFKAVVNDAKVADVVKKESSNGYVLDSVNAGEKDLGAGVFGFKLKFIKKVKDAATGAEKELKKKYKAVVNGQTVTVSDGE